MRKKTERRELPSHYYRTKGTRQLKKDKQQSKREEEEKRAPRSSFEKKEELKLKRCQKNLVKKEKEREGQEEIRD